MKNIKEITIDNTTFKVGDTVNLTVGEYVISLGEVKFGQFKVGDKDTLVYGFYVEEKEGNIALTGDYKVIHTEECKYMKAVKATILKIHQDISYMFKPGETAEEATEHVFEELKEEMKGFIETVKEQEKEGKSVEEQMQVMEVMFKIMLIGHLANRKS